MSAHTELVSFATEALRLSPSIEVQLIPLSGRGSDRSYFRFKWDQTNSAILVHYNPARIENAYFADIAAFLLENGIPAPAIIRHDAVACFILMEDLEDTDLWALRNLQWESRRMLYRQTIEAIHKLHTFPVGRFPADRVKLMEPFSPAYYRWERDYFRTHFIKVLCGIELDPDFSQRLENELFGLAQRLDAGKHCLIHRDLQSQNVMVCRQRPVLIDFQGMRFGSRFYDLGSLLCDPYVSFSGSERTELLSYSFELSNDDLSWMNFQNAFWEASAQRLMQALGAYGLLGIGKGLKHYLLHVPPGLRHLKMAAEKALSLPALLELCQRCDAIIRDSKFEIDDET